MRRRTAIVLGVLILGSICAYIAGRWEWKSPPPPTVSEASDQHKATIGSALDTNGRMMDTFLMLLMALERHRARAETSSAGDSGRHETPRHSAPAR